MNEELVLSVSHVSGGYHEGGRFRKGTYQEVLHDVTFDVHDGEILGLVGSPARANPPCPGPFWE